MDRGVIKKLDDYTFTISIPIPDELSAYNADIVKDLVRQHSLAVLPSLALRNVYIFKTDPCKWQTELQSVEDDTITYVLFYDEDEDECEDEDEDVENDDSNMLTAYYKDTNPVIAVYTNSTDFRCTISAYKGTLSYYVQGDSFYLVVSPEARAFVLDTNYTYIFTDEYAKNKLAYFKEHSIPVNEIQGGI